MNVNYRKLLKKYMVHILESEGISYVMTIDPARFSEAEQKILQDLERETIKMVERTS